MNPLKPKNNRRKVFLKYVSWLAFWITLFSGLQDVFGICQLKLFFSILGAILSLQKSCKHNIESSHLSLTQLPLMLTFYRYIDQTKKPTFGTVSLTRLQTWEFTSFALTSLFLFKIQSRIPHCLCSSCLCSFLPSVMFVCTCAESLKSCPTLCDPMNHSLPGSSVHGILQARILEWVAIPSSRGSSWPGNWTHVSYVFCLDMQVLYH